MTSAALKHVVIVKIVKRVKLILENVTTMDVHFQDLNRLSVVVSFENKLTSRIVFMCQAQFWMLNYQGNIIYNAKLVLNFYIFIETQLKLKLRFIYMSSIQCKNVIQTII